MESNIRHLRNEKKISQTTLADVLGKTQQSVSHMERDRNRISVDSLIVMAEYFGVSTDYILGIGPKPERPTDLKTSGEDAKGQKKDMPKMSREGIYQLILSLLLCSLEQNDAAPDMT